MKNKENTTQNQNKENKDVDINCTTDYFQMTDYEIKEAYDAAMSMAEIYG